MIAMLVRKLRLTRRCRHLVAVIATATALGGVLWVGTLTPVHGEESNWCVKDSEYIDVFKGSVDDLRWSLFALSQLPYVSQVPEHSIRIFVDISVVSLSNVLSLRARYLQSCDFSRDDYFRLLGENQKLAELLLQVTSSKGFPASQFIAQKYPQFAVIVDSSSPDVRKLPLSKAVYERLEQLRTESARGSVGEPSSNPYFIAASELLRPEQQPWDESKVKPLTIIPLNPSNALSKWTLAETIRNVHEKQSLEPLESLRYYYDSGKTPKDAPESLLR